MAPRRAVRGTPARRNVEEQKLPNASEKQSEEEVDQQKGDRQEGADTSMISEFLRMNPPSFTGLSTTEVPENFIEDLKKWKGDRAENAPHASWACFEEAFLESFFPRKLKEAKQVEEEKMRDREEFKNKRAKTGNESGQ
uniref:Retrotransposon gag protein n=1 Tax=Solanum tuberosum TaxID=4113 RepID=M1DZK5_SOLTU